MDFYKTKPQLTNKTRSKTHRNRPILRFKLKKVQRYHPNKKHPKMGCFSVFSEKLKILVLGLQKFRVLFVV